jgi:hypothetical protein
MHGQSFLINRTAGVDTIEWFIAFNPRFTDDTLKEYKAESSADGRGFVRLVKAMAEK